LGFDGKLELPPGQLNTTGNCAHNVQHNDVLEMASEDFQAAAGLSDEWPRYIALLAIHCKIAELMSTDDSSVILIPVRGFLPANQSTNNKWETWLLTWDRRPLGSGVYSNK
jgi:hypothetical protein